MRLVHLKWLILMLAGFAVLLLSCSQKEPETFPEEYMGNWSGKATIMQAPIRSTTKEYEMQVKLFITPNGSVFGKVGDATIKPSRLTRTTALMRYMGNKDWRSNILLAGKLVVEEDYTDGEGCLLFRNIDQGFLKTGFKLHTYINGKRVRVLVSNISFKKDAE